MLNGIFISTMSEICGCNIGRCCDAILFDDNAKVRQGWTMGEAIDPTEIDIVEYLKGLLNQ